MAIGAKSYSRYPRNADVAGICFGLWTVVGHAGQKDGLSAVHCRCSCGTERTVAWTQLARGRSTNCGCVRAAKARQTSINKGASHLTNSPEKLSWRSALARCHNPNDPGYHRYGGRGIVVCDKWRNNFESFLSDMGPRPSGTSLDRIDNGGNYEPGNCRWSTRHEQALNKRSNVMITIGGETKCMIEWCRHFGIDKSVAQKRISDMGWHPADAVSRPARVLKRRT